MSDLRIITLLYENINKRYLEPFKEKKNRVNFEESKLLRPDQNVTTAVQKYFGRLVGLSIRVSIVVLHYISVFASGIQPYVGDIWVLYRIRILTFSKVTYSQIHNILLRNQFRHQ
jgi:hypothetical protein